MIKNIEKIMGFLCSIIFYIVIGIPQMASASGVSINETNFPDAVFRNYVSIEFDQNKDGILSDEEINEITQVCVDGKGIKSLKGIEYFTSLYNLLCRNNQLTALNISNNTALQWLYCSNNMLTVLDISNNTVLTELDCSCNQLTVLDASKNTILQELDCGINQLTNLNVSKNSVLINLNCSINQLTNLNIANSIALTELYCGENQLTTLDTSNNIALTKLHCGGDSSDDSCGNQLTTLDTSNNIALTELYCSCNQLTSLNITKNIALTKLHCGGNQLTTLDISNNIALTELHCGSNDYQEYGGNQLRNLDISNNTVLIWLNCSNNQLTTLDISKNSVLTILECSDNQLTTLDASKNSVLTGLYCVSNPLLELKLNRQTYDKLQLYSSDLHGYNVDFSNLQNVIKIKVGTAKDDSDIFLIKVIDITKPANYKVNGKDFTIIYVNETILPTPVPPYKPGVESYAHIFSDYNYNNPITSSSVVIYGNGVKGTIDGKKINNKTVTVYTDIIASYKNILNNNGIVKSSVGKVIVGITKSDIKPEINNKNKIIDTSASNIAKAKIKNGQITITTIGKESGLVYLWVIDTGNKGVSACCPINVKLAPKKLEVQDISGNKLQNISLENGKTPDVYITGIVSDQIKTNDCTYTAIVDHKNQAYITVTSVVGSPNKFTIKAINLNNTKNTNVYVTFMCNQNGKKVKFYLTITK